MYDQGKTGDSGAQLQSITGGLLSLGRIKKPWKRHRKITTTTTVRHRLAPVTEQVITLHEAARQGDDITVKALLQTPGVDVESRDGEGFTPLHIAVYIGHVATVQLLLDRNADVDARFDSGWTLLHLAARYGHRPTVQLLLDQNADIEVK